MSSGTDRFGLGLPADAMVVTSPERFACNVLVSFAKMCAEGCRVAGIIYMGFLRGEPCVTAPKNVLCFELIPSGRCSAGSRWP